MQSAAPLRLALVPVVVSFLLSASGSAVAQVQLEWKFPENAQWKTRAVHKTQQTLGVGGLDIVTSQEMTTRHHTSVGRRDSDGNIDVTSQFTSLQSKVGLPFGAELKFDSSQENEPQGTQFDFMLEVFEALSELRYTASYDRDNQLRKVKVDPEALAELGETGQEVIKDQIAPEFLAQVIRQQMRVIPDRPVKPGDSWEVAQTMQLAGGQSLTTTTRYRYEGTVRKQDKELHKITAEALKVTYEQNADAPLKVSESDLRIQSTDSYVLFDAALGQIVEQQIKHEITGKMKFDLDNAATDGSLNLKLERLTVLE